MESEVDDIEDVSSLNTDEVSFSTASCRTKGKGTWGVGTRGEEEGWEIGSRGDWRLMGFVGERWVAWGFNALD